MAIRLVDQYGNAIAADADYPGGSFKNRTAPAAEDGTPLERAWANDLWGFGDALLLAAGVTRSGAPDTAVSSDRFNALKILLRRYGTPAGEVALFARKNNNPPDGWLVANGQVVLRADYPDLFDAIDVTFNTGGELGTEFRLPDARGTFLRCLALGKVGSDPDATRVNGSIQTDALQNFGGSFGTPIWPATNITTGAFTNAGVVFSTYNSGPGAVNGNQINFSVAASGARTAIETRPLNMGLLPCIKW